MVSLINVISDIESDFNEKLYIESKALTRRFILKRGNIFFVTVEKKTKLCEVSFGISEDITNAELNSLPQWKGMEEICIMVPNDNEVNRRLVFKQLEGYDRAIFIKVMQDLIDAIDDVSKEHCIATIKKTLQKWSVFFRFEKNYILSENAQQGLYGELIVLEKMIQKKGNKALGCWTGYNAESHDFYFGNDAVEVKSSSAKGPESVQINNEYQLDESDVIGNLYLMYLSIKKSTVDGEILPDIVNRIMFNLDINQRERFSDNLFKVGYIITMPELYNYHFRLRDESCFIVKDKFPRITSKTIEKGIGSVNYTISLDACRSYMVEIESFYKGVNF